MIPSPQRTFRATLDAWLGHLILPCLFYFVLIYTIMHMIPLPVVIGGIGAGLVVILYGLNALLPMAYNYLQVDTKTLRGSLNGHNFNVEWSDVIAAWKMDGKRGRLICLGTRCGTIIIPTRFLAHDEIWDVMVSNISPAALEKEALQAVPDLYELRRFEGQAEPLEQGACAAVQMVDHPLIQVIGWVVLMTCLISTVIAVRNGFFGAGAAALGGAVAALVVLLGWGVTEFGPENVERDLLFSGWTMAWDDVEWIEVDPVDFVMVLCSKEQRLTIPGPVLWGGEARRRAMIRILQETDRRRIPIRRSLLALFKTSRRTKMAK